MNISRVFWTFFWWVIAIIVPNSNFLEPVIDECIFSKKTQLQIVFQADDFSHRLHDTTQTLYAVIGLLSQWCQFFLLSFFYLCQAQKLLSISIIKVVFWIHFLQKSYIVLSAIIFNEVIFQSATYWISKYSISNILSNI